MAEQSRLDAALVASGLARSRGVAAQLIESGAVRVSGAEIRKASYRVTEGAVIEVSGTDHYVSRGAHKLIAALDGFAIDVSGRLALDAGASTGGFTQVLLERGARRVVALDVGHGQLALPLALDARVESHEGVNVRDLDAASLRSLTGSSDRPSMVVADLSFISLKHVLAPLASVAADDADLVVLVKPQFEVGRTGIREGIVRDAGLRADAIAGVLWEAWDVGLGTAGLISSPILGGAGNHEYLLHLSSSRGANPSEWEDRLPSIAGA